MCMCSVEPGECAVWNHACSVDPCLQCGTTNILVVDSLSHSVYTWLHHIAIAIGHQVLQVAYKLTGCQSVYSVYLNCVKIGVARCELRIPGLVGEIGMHELGPSCVMQYGMHPAF